MFVSGGHRDACSHAWPSDLNVHVKSVDRLFSGLIESERRSCFENSYIGKLELIGILGPESC